MNSNNITVLREHGFDVTKLSTKIATVVTHTKPFCVISESGKPIASNLNEHDKYQVVFEKWFNGDTLDRSIVQSPFSMISDLEHRSHNTIAENSDIPSNTPPSNVQVPFSSVPVNAAFIHNGKQYTKLHESTAIMATSKLVQPFERAFSPESMVEMAPPAQPDDQQQWTHLSDDQMHTLVAYLPPDLDHDQLVELINQDLDDVAGMELMDDQQREQLVDKLVQLYNQQ